MKSQKKSHPQKPESPATPLIPMNPEDLRWEMQQVQLAITRRAYELFETRGREHGHDWEDWFRAQSELLRPVSIAISELEDRISIRANVLGFEANELKVSVEPRRITIVGEKKLGATETEGRKVGLLVSYPDQILQIIDLATEVTAENATIELQAGLLKFELAKASSQKIKSATAGA